MVKINVITSTNYIIQN